MMLRPTSISIVLAVAAALGGCADPSAPAGPQDSAVSLRDGSRPSLDVDGSTAHDGPPGPGATETPCDVRAVLAERCEECHASPTRFGAPMPLLAPGDFTRPAISDPSRTVGELVLDRVHLEGGLRMPPPPRAALGAGELAALETWIARGSPAAEPGASCEVVAPTGPCVGPECLPCTPSATFTAHGATADEPFEVPPEGNPYRCFAFPSPFTASERAIAWAPILGDTRVLHHLILYRTRTPQAVGAMPCEAMPADAVGMMGWAPGAPNVVLPSDVGLELSSGGPDAGPEWIVLQAHYYNAAGLTDARDRSGFAVCASAEPRTHTAAVMTFGSVAIAIAPRSRAQEVAGLCPSSSTALLGGPLTVLASGPHMHARGRRFVVEVLRGGIELETMLDVDPFRFDDQRGYWHDPTFEIRPGDAVRTRCIYDNPDPEWVFYGERTEDEMCFDFAVVYPVSAIPERYARTCVTSLGL
jgi:hypothetical protein